MKEAFEDLTRYIDTLPSERDKRIIYQRLECLADIAPHISKEDWNEFQEYADSRVREIQLKGQELPEFNDNP